MERDVPPASPHPAAAASQTSRPHLHRPGPAKEPEQGGEQETRSVQADRLSGEEKGAQEITVQLSQEGPGE